MTATGPNNHHWLRKWLRLEPHQPIGAEGEAPYLLRWYVIPRNRWLNIYLHKFLRDDDDRALHDHPWWFVSLMLWGQYVEVTEEGRSVRSAPEPWRFFWGDRPLAFRRGTWRHRVELVPAATHSNQFLARRDQRKLPCWTLIVTGRRVRLWGFWCKDRADETNVDNAIDRMRVRRGEVFEVDRFIPWDEFGAAGCGEPTTVDEQQRPGTSPTRVIDAAHLARQRAFSLATFGPGARTNGVLDHIGKELNEIRDAPDDISEWVDVIILAFDGAWRAGWEPQQIIDAILAKQTRNEQRTWPDWRTADPNKAIEHVHSDVDGDVNR
ncbi:Protein of uncharacterised function (DUF550) [Mycobacteroides abscessus subsp. bolletii]|uniref:dATP/dGTP pyrophosphohydrolase domain-containing protein n=1 Tax=Mycobacteroides abscessus TaxID=36809 RepID=UPI0009C494AB|nr:dATP/dGTP pyrophosphohydrolase domain-containing protein [Mycobacteroides abscessus]WJJ56106.1 hypothetical protein PROPHIT371_24 [Mycobacterium phage prophiT37-1]SKY23405.1 Protein of uncharacterised function (DUF550) [Mycobacteroides abscessus subsp. bolletii]